MNPLEQLKSVLCDPEGKCCIAGSDEDRAIVDRALQALAQTAQPPQRPWQEPTGNEWFEWWRVSQVANETEAEIDFADFLIIAQAVAAKLKEMNNG